MSEELVLGTTSTSLSSRPRRVSSGFCSSRCSIHIRTLTEKRNAELRSVARSIFLGYVVSLGFGFLALMP